MICGQHCHRTRTEAIVNFFTIVRDAPIVCVAFAIETLLAKPTVLAKHMSANL